MIRLRSLGRFLVAGLLLFGSSLSAGHAATYVLAGGPGSELQGATGVIVNGFIYDVSFTDGTCAELFNPCTSFTDFTFQTAGDANDASEALLTQVFNQGDIYDQDPTLTRGIDDPDLGSIFTPWNSVRGAVELDGMTNNSGLVMDMNICAVGGCGLAVSFDLADRDNSTYAIWTQVSEVPVPAAAWLFITALIGLAGFGRRRKKS